jgi:hypothetical protein
MSMPESEEKENAPESAESSTTPDPEEDFWNCKGRCGYTRWCAACMAERKKAELEEERRRYESGDD